MVICVVEVWDYTANERAIAQPWLHSDLHQCLAQTIHWVAKDMRHISTHWRQRKSKRGREEVGNREVSGGGGLKAECQQSGLPPVLDTCIIDYSRCVLVDTHGGHRRRYQLFSIIVSYNVIVLQ